MRTSQRIIRANKTNPCPVCKGVGCGIGTMKIFCHRVEVGSEKRCENTGAFIHARTDNLAERDLPQRYEPPPPLAPIARRHEVFSAYLEQLELTTAHYEHLTNVRGLSAETVERLQFRSVPSHRLKTVACKALVEKFDLANVPGFYFDAQNQKAWTMRFAAQQGFYVPLRDGQGRIQALQIRRDTEDHGARYWLVSTPHDKFDRGACSGAPPHFVGNRESEKLIITEGGLKAVVCAEQLPEVLFCGLVAVGSFRSNFGWQLRQWFPQVRSIGVAYDHPASERSDRARKNVAAQLERLVKTLTAAGYKPQVLSWPAESGKGFDDYLLNQKGIL